MRCSRLGIEKRGPLDFGVWGATAQKTGLRPAGDIRAKLIGWAFCIRSRPSERLPGKPYRPIPTTDAGRPEGPYATSKLTRFGDHPTQLNPEPLSSMTLPS